MSHLPSPLPSDFAHDAALAAIAASQADPTNESKMRAALELVPYSSIILGPQWYEKPWQLNNIKLCKELKKPMILVCWKDSPLRNDILDGLLVSAVIQLAPEQKSRDPEVQAQIQEAWRKYGGLEPKVWGAHAKGTTTNPRLDDPDKITEMLMRVKLNGGSLWNYVCDNAIPPAMGALPGADALVALSPLSALAAAAASSNAAASVVRPPAPLVPSVSRVHVEVLPPSDYTGMNSEQDFSIRLKEPWRVPGGLLAVGAHVGENRARFANVVSTEGQPATSGEEGQAHVESALDLMGLKITSKSAREGSL
jgi:hypothetical protein